MISQEKAGRKCPKLPALTLHLRGVVTARRRLKTPTCIKVLINLSLPVGLHGPRLHVAALPRLSSCNLCHACPLSASISPWVSGRFTGLAPVRPTYLYPPIICITVMLHSKLLSPHLTWCPILPHLLSYECDSHRILSRLNLSSLPLSLGLCGRSIAPLKNLYFVGTSGFEPEMTEPKSVVLPLHHVPKLTFSKPISQPHSPSLSLSPVLKPSRVS